MPARSTLVQRVVFHIQKQLAAGATVTESAMLPDRSGTGTREVDVAIRTRIGGHEVIISVECREGNRKATVGWVEEMVMKHSALPTSKLVLVSASGFSRSAAEKSESLGVEAYSFEDALDNDWTGLLGSDELCVWTLRIKGCELEVEGDNSGGHTAPPDTAVFRPDGTYRGTLGEIVRSELEGSAEFSEGAIEYASETGSSEFWAECESEPPLVVKDANSKEHTVTTSRVRVEAVRAPGSVNLTRKRYRGASVAYGRGLSPAGEVTLSLIQPSDETAAGALSVVDSDTGRVRTVDVQFTPDRNKLRFIAGPVRMPTGREKRTKG